MIRSSCRRGQAMAKQADPLDEVYAARSRPSLRPDVGCRRRRSRQCATMCIDQGPADHTGRCGIRSRTSRCARSSTLCLSAADPVLHRRAVAAEGAEKTTWSSPRELRGHLRRIEFEAQSEKAKRLSRSCRTTSAARRSAPEHLVHRNQAVCPRHERWSASHPVRYRHTSLGDAGAQGNIMKFTEGGSDWATRWLSANSARTGRRWPVVQFKNPKTGSDIVVKDSIADAFCSRSCCARRNTR